MLKIKNQITADISGVADGAECYFKTVQAYQESGGNRHDHQIAPIFPLAHYRNQKEIKKQKVKNMEKSKHPFNVSPETQIKINAKKRRKQNSREISGQTD